jgi:hypothetical protein
MLWCSATSGEGAAAAARRGFVVATARSRAARCGEAVSRGPVS